MINYPGLYTDTRHYFWYKLIQSRCKLQFHILGLKNNENSHKCFFLFQAQTILEVDKIFGAIHCLSLYQNNLYRNDFGWSGIMMTSLSRVNSLAPLVSHDLLDLRSLILICLPGAWGVDWVSFCWVCAAGISQRLPHYSLYYGTNLKSLLGKCNSCNPNLFSYCLCIYLKKLFN